MKTPIFFAGSSTSNLSLTANRYAPFASGGYNVAAYGTSENPLAQAQRAPCAGTITNIRARFPEPLDSGKFVISLMKGSAQTGMTAVATMEITAGITDKIDLVSSVTVAEGEYLAWRFVPESVVLSGGATSLTRSIHMSCVFESATAGRQPIFSYVSTGTAAASAIPLGSGSSSGTSEASATIVFPVGGTITKLYSSLSANIPPGSGNTRTLTLRKGTAVGGLTDTAMTVTFGATDFEKSKLDTPIKVSAGDFIVVGHAITGTPTGSPIKVGVEFIPTTSGDSVHFSINPGSMSASAVRYTNLAGYNGATGDGTESNVAQPAPADLTVKMLRVDAAAAPGTSKSRELALRKNSTTTALNPVLSDGALTAQEVTDVAIVSGDLLNFMHTPTGSPSTVTWTATSTVIRVSNTVAPTPLTLITKPDGHVFEGVKGKGVARFSGTRPSGELVEAQIVTPEDVVVLAYGSTNITISYPTATTWTATALLDASSTDMRPRARLKNTPSTIANTTNYFGVGFVLLVNGQSWLQRGSTQGKGTNGALTSVTPNNVRLAQTVNRDFISSVSYRVDRLNTADKTGSGYTALADQIGLMLGGTTLPIMVFDCTYSGQAIDDWLYDKLPPTTGSDWPLLTGFLAWSIAQCDGRVTAVVREVMFGSSKAGTRGAALDELTAFIDSKMVNQPVDGPWEMWLLGGWRSPSSSTRSFIISRTELREKAIANPDRYKSLPIENGIQTDSNAGNHAAVGTGSEEGTPKDATPEAHQAGQIRMFRYIARGIVAQMQRLLGLTVTDVFGPRIVSVKFTSAAKTAFDVVFDRDIRTPSGATTNLPQHWVSTNNFATSSSNTECTGTIIGPRTVRVAHPTGGNWQSATIRYGYICGDMPWPTTTEAQNGNEADIRTKLDTLIYDTSSYEGGRGINAEPTLGTGLAIEDASAQTYTTIAKDAYVTLTKAQLATLRVKDGTRTTGTVGAEPFSLRWERKTGDLTGKPIDGINVPVTVG